MEQLLSNALQGIVASGPMAVLLLYFLFEERKERKAVQAWKDKLLDDMLKDDQHKAGGTT